LRRLRREGAASQSTDPATMTTSNREYGAFYPPDRMGSRSGPLGARATAAAAEGGYDFDAPVRGGKYAASFRTQQLPGAKQPNLLHGTRCLLTALSPLGG
jgi:hypothetical protein